MSSLPKIIITGCKGQIGTALMQHRLAKKFTIIHCDRKQLDITHPLSIQHAIHHYQPDIIINTAAFTAVDAAEHNKIDVISTNDHGVRNLAVACHDHQVLLLHLSTDYVFNGQKTTPYDEEDTPAPLNIYGESKLAGEEIIRTTLPQHIILRVSSVFSATGNNFLKTMVRLAHVRDELTIVSDQIICPTHADHIAAVIYSLLKNPHTFGTYHYCDKAPTSWYEFADTIIQTARDLCSLKVKKIRAIGTHDYQTPAKRPLYSVLSCNKIKKDYDIHQADWSHTLTHTIQKLIMGTSYE